MSEQVEERRKEEAKSREKKKRINGKTWPASGKRVTEAERSQKTSEEASVSAGAVPHSIYTMMIVCSALNTLFCLSAGASFFQPVIFLDRISCVPKSNYSGCVIKI